jgi:hypothetical protein
MSKLPGCNGERVLQKLYGSEDKSLEFYNYTRIIFIFCHYFLLLCISNLLLYTDI